MARKRRGRLIVLEGIDGAGTTTQAERLVRRLREAGERAHLTCEPSSGPVGSVLRQVLRGRVVAGRGPEGPLPVDGGTVALLFAADRLDHLAAEIEPLLAEGVHVVSDRYVVSSLAYQGLENDLEWVRAINARARPADLTVFLEVPAAVAARRRSDRSEEERFETLPTQRRVARAYRKILADHEGPLVTLDGRQDAQSVADALWEAVRTHLRRRR